MNYESENELKNFTRFRCRVFGKSLTSNKALAEHKCSHRTVDCDICHKAVRAIKMLIHKDKHKLYGDDAKRNVKIDNHSGFEDLDAKLSH